MNRQNHGFCKWGRALRGKAAARGACLLLWGLAILLVPASNGQHKKPEPVRVILDVSEVPKLKPWADKSKTLVEAWYPKVSDMLKTDGFTPPDEVTIYFKKDMKGVAFASGKKITIAADWITQHPDDFGMVIHEMTHVVQSYRRGNKDAGWLVEGIADYIRFMKYEPKAPLGRIDPAKASYKDGYRTSAAFLAWIEKTHDKKIVAKMNQALRDGDYQPEMFERETGKNLDELWKGFVKTLK